MYKSLHPSTKLRFAKKSTGLNISKLQAVLCIATSAVVSTGLLALGVQPFI